MPNKGFQVGQITVSFLFVPHLFKPTVICRLKRRYAYWVDLHES